MLLPIFHLSAAALNSFAFWYDQTYVELPLENPLVKQLPLKSRSMFLTMWCLILQIAYHIIAFLNDILGSNAASPKKKPLIRLIKDTYFSLAFPVALYVSIAFWGLYIFDKDLIFPDHIEKLYPPWVNHVMHTTVSVFMFIELIATRRNYPSRTVGMTLCTVYGASYIMWLLIIYFRTESWVYPVFEPLSWPFRILFLAFSIIIVNVFYLLSEKLNSLTSPSSARYSNGKFKSR